MKRLMSITLAVVLVLALGSWAFAIEGTLDENHQDYVPLEVEIPVYATIGPYAKVWKIQDVNFGTLKGQVGIYTANGLDGTPLEFRDRAADKWGVSRDLYVDNNDGYGAFKVETNTHLTIALDFVPGDNWVGSPTLFGIARQYDPETVRAWAGSNYIGEEELNSSFTHVYEKGEVYYGIDGAIYIQSISEQFAKDYNATLVVTISKLENSVE